MLKKKGVNLLRTVMYRLWHIEEPKWERIPSLQVVADAAEFSALPR